MDYKKIQQLAKQIEPMGFTILSEFNQVLKKHGINANVIEFSLEENDHNAMMKEMTSQGMSCSFCCRPCGRSTCCGICCKF